MKVTTFRDYVAGSGTGLGGLRLSDHFPNSFLDATLLLDDCDVCRGKPQELMSCGCANRKWVVPKKQWEAFVEAFRLEMAKWDATGAMPIWDEAERGAARIATALLGGPVYQALEVWEVTTSNWVAITDEVGDAVMRTEVADGARIAIIESEAVDE